MATQVDLDTLIDSSRLGGFQRGVIALCAIMVMIDGFDTQVIGMVAPAMAASWHTAPAAFGIVFATGLFGGLIGVLALGTAADQLGR
jgi:AAHS family 4-hydroxybenzoate transporter-like MFS transporter